MAQFAFLVASTLAASSGLAAGSRVHLHAASVASAGKKGPHLCTISWPSKGYITNVSFGVAKCQVECLRTNANNRYDLKYANIFTPEQSGSWCKCMHEGEQIVKFWGDCQTAEPTPGAKCFQDWTTVRTKTYKKEEGRKTWIVESHPKHYAPETYEYNCARNACPDGCEDSVQMPRLTDGADEDEQEFIVHVLSKKRRGDKLSADERIVAETIPENDIEAILFQELLKKYDGRLTVDLLRSDYEDRLGGSGVSVGHMLEIAGLTEGDEEVDLQKYKKFLKPRC